MAQDDTVYRCVAASCGRLTPRRVNFCPWCGTAQPAAAPGAAPHPPLAPPMLDKPFPDAAQPVVPAAAPPVPPPAAPQAPARGQPAPPQPSTPPPRPPVPPPGHTQERVAGGAQGRPGQGIPPPPGVGRGAPVPAQPPRRAPVRLRWWILSLGALWIIWLTVRPEGSRIERRMDRAVALAVECKAREAQDELIALRGTRATPDQLRQVQQSLNKAAADCTRAEQRARAWSEAEGAVRKLRRARSYDKALARLAAFTRRWGEDDATRALRRDIDDEREHPLADPTRNE